MSSKAVDMLGHPPGIKFCPNDVELVEFFLRSCHLSRQIIPLPSDLSRSKNNQIIETTITIHHVKQGNQDVGPCHTNIKLNNKSKKQDRRIWK
ncbi:unnamed protein product [Urochloa humidicola]